MREELIKFKISVNNTSERSMWDLRKQKKMKRDEEFGLRM